MVIMKFTNQVVTICQRRKIEYISEPSLIAVVP